MSRQTSSHKLWPEDPLGPPLTRAELNRSIRTPALREKLGLSPVPPKPDRNLDQQVRCQECRTVMQMRDVPFHECAMVDSEAERDLLSLL